MLRMVIALVCLVASPLAALSQTAASVPATSAVVAVDPGQDPPDAADKSQVRTKDAGSIEGDVVSVDYRTSHFSVKVGTTTYDIVVLPSTDFESKNNTFQGITDIKKGAHVSVMLSQRAATYVAQIIHLR